MLGDPILGPIRPVSSYARRSLVFIIAVLVSLVVMPIVIVVGIALISIISERAKTSAEPNKFADVLEIEEILASKRHHTWFGHTFQCRFEAVRFSVASAERFEGEDANDIVYPGRSRQLKPTPMKPFSETRGGETDRYYCLFANGSKLAAVLHKAAYSSGSWYSESGVLIVPEHRIAIWATYGD